MNARRLRWHGAARQQALADRLQLELKAWLDDWSVDPALLLLRVAGDGPALPSDWRWLEATSRNGTVVLGARSTELAGLGGLLAKAASEDSLELGSRIGNRALRALMGQFVGGAANAIIFQASESPSAEHMDPRFGCCAFALSGAGFDARLFVDNALSEYLVPPKRPTLAPLLPRESALGNENVTLRVLLDLGSAHLADTQDLQVGDVLVSSAPIDSLFQLVLPDARRLVTANLVRKGDRRAVQIDTSIPGTNP